MQNALQTRANQVKLRLRQLVDESFEFFSGGHGGTRIACTEDLWSDEDLWLGTSSHGGRDSKMPTTTQGCVHWCNRVIARAASFPIPAFGFPSLLSWSPLRISSTKIFVDNYEGLRIWFIHENQARKFTEADRGGA